MREYIRQLILKIKNNKDKSSNDRFVVAEVLNELNENKYGKEDSYTKDEVNILIAGSMQGDYVPLAGTTITKPITGTLIGQPSATLDPNAGFFTLGNVNGSPVDPGNYGLITRNYNKNQTTGVVRNSILNVKNNLEFSISEMNPSANTIFDYGFAVNPGVFSAWVRNQTNNISNILSLTDDRLEIGIGLDGINRKTWAFDEISGLIGTAYYTPTSDNQYVQKKYVDDAVAGVSPSGYIPLTGTTNLTGKIIRTTYEVPTIDRELVQKKYVDDRFNAVPTNYIPLAGSALITGGLTGGAYYAPTNAFSFVQQKYVDDKFATVPTNYVPLAGTTALTGKIQRTTYVAPTDDKELVQKKYVDDKGLTYIPLAGSTAITGGLRRTSYVAPTVDADFIQKKYVDDRFNAVPTNYIPLTGSTAITGGLQRTTYVAPTDDKDFVQKKYVDDKVGSGTGGGIPFTGTPDNQTASGRLEVVTGDQSVRIGTPNNSTKGGNYGIMVDSGGGANVENYRFNAGFDGFDTTHSYTDGSNYIATIMSSIGNGNYLEHKSGRGSTYIRNEANGVEIGAYTTQQYNSNIIFSYEGKLYASEVYDFEKYMDRSFIQKALLVDSHTLSYKESHNTRGLYKKSAIGNPLDEIHCAIIKPTLPTSITTQPYDIDITQFNLNILEIVDIRGKSVYIDGVNSRTIMVNSPSDRSVWIDVVHGNDEIPTHLSLSGKTGGDSVINQHDLYIYLYYTKQ